MDIALGLLVMVLVLTVFAKAMAALWRQFRTGSFLAALDPGVEVEKLAEFSVGAYMNASQTLRIFRVGNPASGQPRRIGLETHAAGSGRRYMHAMEIGTEEALKLADLLEARARR